MLRQAMIIVCLLCIALTLIIVSFAYETRLNHEAVEKCAGFVVIDVQRNYRCINQ